MTEKKELREIEFEGPLGSFAGVEDVTIEELLLGLRAILIELERRELKDVKPNDE